MTSCLITWRMKSSQNGVNSSLGENSFLYEMTAIYMGGNSENDRVASPKSEPIYFNAYLI